MTTFVQRLLLPVLALLVLCGGASAQTGRRVALVIGNGSYAGQTRLPNPPNDARRIAELLRGELGFEVQAPLLDGSLRQMDEALDRFRRAAQGADVALFFYAGHGMELGGQNRLVPVDAQLAHERDVERQTIPLETVLQAMAGARSKLVLLDACRNNPLASRMVRLTPLARGEGAGGLTEVRQVSRGTVIVFAAAPGQTAADGDGVNSPFTAALLQNLAKPGEDVRVVLGDVSDAVERSTGGRQQPWINFTGLSGRLSLRPGPAPPVPAPPQPVAVLPPPAPGPTPPAPQPASATGYPVGVGQVFRDCGDCPEMVVVPAGRFRMGSPASELGREADEGPQQEVVVRSPFALGRYHVTVGEYRAFATASGLRAAGSCFLWNGSQEENRAGVTWRNPGYAQTERDPVVCINWDDAQAYLRWLSGRTRKSYRLPTEAEWEYAARAGGTTRWWWGDSESAQCGAANGADPAWLETLPGSPNWLVAPCRDGFVFTAPVGRFRANDFGLYDMGGNAWQWVADCYAQNYAAAPGSAPAARAPGYCPTRVLRGGSWNASPQFLRSAYRVSVQGGTRDYRNGFRIVRQPDRPAVPQQAALVPPMPPPPPVPVPVPATAPKPPPVPALPTPAPAPVMPAPQPVSTTGYPVAVGQTFRDCDDCPEMVVIPAGRFLMGSPAAETGRYSNEGPQREVVVRSPFALGRYHVTVGEYRAFATATGRGDRGSCYVWNGRSPEERAGAGWRNPGFAQSDRDPVVCVGWEDAQDYVRWLSARTGRAYRLPTEAEWEYAARAGSTSRWYWGENEAAQCGAANGADQSAREAMPGTSGWVTAPPCHDGFAYTSPVGRYAANRFGLSDMSGNAWQWVADCYAANYAGAPVDAGISNLAGNCDWRILRGGSWWNLPQDLRSANRFWLAPNFRLSYGGFRIVRTSGP